MKTKPSVILPCILTLALALATAASAPAAPLVDTSFEGRVPERLRFHLNPKHTFDTARVHTGKHSLRLEATAEWGGSFFFPLSDMMDFTTDLEFSAWVFVEKPGTVSVYISADPGEGRGRVGIIDAGGYMKPGEWNFVSGIVRASDWHPAYTATSLNFRVIGEGTVAWFDDIKVNIGNLTSPADAWPKLKDALNKAAARRATALAPGAAITLTPANAAFAPDTARLEVIPPGNAPGKAVSPKPPPAGALGKRSLPIENPESKIENPTTTLIPAEGLLVFAIDATDDLNLTGTLHLEHTAPTPGRAVSPKPPSDGALGDHALPSDNPQSAIQNPQSLDLRPGLRAYVLANDTIVAAPNIATTTPWTSPVIAGRPAAAPEVRGEPPPSEIQLTGFRLSKGRNYITVAGPHFRPGGVFKKLELRAGAQPAQKPLHTFALIADTHIGYARYEWTNIKLMSSSAGELENTLRQLKREGIEYVVTAGDLTDEGTLRQFTDLARAVKRGGLPVYACLGSHDTFVRNAREHMSAIRALFPGGPGNTDYAFTRAPLRFIVLDGSWWHDKDGSILPHRAGARHPYFREGALDWLRATLAADTKTPTIIVNHDKTYLSLGVSSSGHDFGEAVIDQPLMDTLSAAPNVVATLTGHFHLNDVSDYKSITCISTPPFVEWPNTYRVLRVYSDRIEWEMRQIPNRGLIRESALPKHALFQMLSTREGDLGGTIPLALRAAENSKSQTPPGHQRRSANSE